MKIKTSEYDTHAKEVFVNLCADKWSLFLSECREAHTIWPYELHALFLMQQMQLVFAKNV